MTTQNEYLKSYLRKCGEKKQIVIKSLKKKQEFKVWLTSNAGALCCAF